MRIFLSYARADESFVSKLTRDLREAGFRCWLDTEEILVGQPIADRILSGIHSSDLFLVVLSPASVQREWVSRELSAAFLRQLTAKRVFILPVLLSPVTTEVLPLELAGLKWADFSRSYDAGLLELLRSIRAYATQIGTDPIHQAVQANVDEFAHLLSSRPDTERLRDYIDSHPELLQSFVGGSSRAILVLRDVALGAQRTIDFLMVEGSSMGLEVFLIKLDPPHARIAGADGQPTESFFISYQTVHDWVTWANEHRSAVGEAVLKPHKLGSVAHLNHIFGKLIMGRRASITEADQKAARLAAERIHRGDLWPLIKVHTYDHLLHAYEARGNLYTKVG